MSWKPIPQIYYRLFGLGVGFRWCEHITKVIKSKQFNNSTPINTDTHVNILDVRKIQLFQTNSVKDLVMIISVVSVSLRKILYLSPTSVLNLCRTFRLASPISFVHQTVRSVLYKWEDFVNLRHSKHAQKPNWILVSQLRNWVVVCHCLCCMKVL